ncbi:unnamed protein product [Rotaria socialis]|nr:unnamed protein product [Rotaria socialis]CAF3209836.1 unnamed protein product [Rotaria socialis]CAF3297449.1 unnamed protein product [Rotaria socialis]
MMIVLILIALTQIILAHPIHNDTLSTTSTLAFDSMTDTVTVDFILTSPSSKDMLPTNSTFASQSVNDTSTIGFMTNARDVFSKPSLSRQLSVPVAFAMIGGSVIGLGSGLALLWILYKKNVVPKSVAST